MTSCINLRKPEGRLTALQSSPDMDLTGFLFGNVNEEGELEDESLLDRVYLFKAHYIQQY